MKNESLRRHLLIAKSLSQLFSVHITYLRARTEVITYHLLTAKSLSQLLCTSVVYVAMIDCILRGPDSRLSLPAYMYAFVTDGPLFLYVQVNFI